MLVIARNYGQLGNRLFLYAHLIAATRHWGITMSNPCFAEYADFFQGTCDDLWCRYPTQPTRSAPSRRRRKMMAKAANWLARLAAVFEKTCCKMGVSQRFARSVRLRGSAESLDLQSPTLGWELQRYDYWFAQGWLFRSDVLVDRHADAIRAHFRLIPRHAEAVERLGRELRRDSDVVVGIHIRGGDYATFHNGKYFYTLEQYLDAMRAIAQQIPHLRVVFLVCSNTPLCAADFPGLRVIFGPGPMVEDMYGLAVTDLIVGPPSTFSGWAAFYGNVPLAVLETATTEVSIAQHLPQLARSAA